MENSPPPKTNHRVTTKKPTNNGLPKECLEDNTWWKRVITTLIRWAGIQPNPWIILDNNLADALQKICDAYYGTTIELTITTDSTAFRLVGCHYMNYIKLICIYRPHNDWATRGTARLAPQLLLLWMHFLTPRMSIAIRTICARNMLNTLLISYDLPIARLRVLIKRWSPSWQPAQILNVLLFTEIQGPIPWLPCYPNACSSLQCNWWLQVDSWLIWGGYTTHRKLCLGTSGSSCKLSLPTWLYLTKSQTSLSVPLC